MVDSQTIQERILNDSEFRKKITKESYYWFFHTYFPHYIKYQTGTLHKEIYKDLENFSNEFIEILAFRGCAKSTIVDMGFPIWSIIKGVAHFPVLTSDTFGQAKLYIYNLKAELDNNKLLISDWGPFEENEEWSSTDIVLPQFDARISAKSMGQKIRGIRHRQYRPDLLIADDLQNIETVRTKEQRDKDVRWFIDEALPAVETKGGRVILIGNLLHSDCLMMRIKKEILANIRDGLVKEYPFFDKNKVPYWKEKFNSSEMIEKEMRKYGGKDSRTWQREFLLKIVPEEGQEIKDDWIKNNYYDELPKEELFAEGTGVDLAISKKASADCTAMVSAKLFIIDERPIIYIMPNPVNDKLSQNETVDKARDVSTALGDGTLTDLWVEDVGYQRAAIEQMVNKGLPATGVTVTTDKRARLRTNAVYVQANQVKFPRVGCEDLIIQLLGFGVEAHDDLVDAFDIVVSKLMEQRAHEPSIRFL